MASAVMADNTSKAEVSECIGGDLDCSVVTDKLSNNNFNDLRENRSLPAAVDTHSSNKNKNKSGLKGVSHTKNRRHSDGEFLISTQGKLKPLIGGARGREHLISEEEVQFPTRTSSTLMSDAMSAEDILNEKNKNDEGGSNIAKNDDSDSKSDIIVVNGGDSSESYDVKSAVTDGDSSIISAAPALPKKRGRKPKSPCTEGCEYKKPRRVITTKLEHHPDESESEGSNLSNQYKGDLTIVKDFCVHVHLCIPLDMETNTNKNDNKNDTTGCGYTSNHTCHDVE